MSDRPAPLSVLEAEKRSLLAILNTANDRSPADQMRANWQQQARLYAALSEHPDAGIAEAGRQSARLAAQALELLDALARLEDLRSD